MSDDPIEMAKKAAAQLGIGDINMPFRSHPEDRTRYIKNQERARATGATENQRLPWRGRTCLDKHGFVFGEQVDEIYVTVTNWPEGFTHKHMEDPRGFWIIGPDGKTVAQGMIKDTSYDRYATIWKDVGNDPS